MDKWKIKEWIHNDISALATGPLCELTAKTTGDMIKWLNTIQAAKVYTRKKHDKEDQQHFTRTQAQVQAQVQARTIMNSQFYAY